MARQQKVTIELEYTEIIDGIVALRTRSEVLAYRSPEFARAYTELADRFVALVGDML
jgi:hypothetical protein